MAQSNVPFKKSPRTDDPQIITTGYIKRSSQDTELISFTVNLALFQLVCIVNIPGEGEDHAPVYVKFKCREPKLVPVDRSRRDVRDTRNGDHGDDQGDYDDGPGD